MNVRKVSDGRARDDAVPVPPRSEGRGPVPSLAARVGLHPGYAGRPGSPRAPSWRCGRRGCRTTSAAGLTYWRSVPPRCPERSEPLAGPVSCTASVSPGRAATSTSSGRTPGTHADRQHAAQRSARIQAAIASGVDAVGGPDAGGSAVGLATSSLHRRRDDGRIVSVGRAPARP